MKKTKVDWLDWRKGGPGNGVYRLYVREIDAAGNRDVYYRMGGPGSNVYEWYYVSPTPWDIIAEVIGSVLGLVIFSYMEYRRRVKKAAMERYAMKRMRRKFKAMQRDIDGRAVDWRTLYMESKEAETAGGRRRRQKEKKGSRDKKADKREKEKKKREKEKERIKKKLKGNKEEAKRAAAPEVSAAPISSKEKDKEKAKKEKDKMKKKKVEEDEEDVEVEVKVKKGKSSKQAKFKEYEVEGKEGEEVVDPKSKKKMKDYEIAGGAGGGAVAPQLSELEQGTKQRKTNKRYKDNEQDLQGREDDGVEAAKKNL